MITIKPFTNRLGNQLFQIAAGLGTARRNSAQFHCPEWSYAKYFKGDFSVSECLIGFQYSWHHFHYKEIPYRKCLAIDGYFQSEKYFIDQEEEIRAAFQFTDLAKPSFKFSNSEISCAIHVRRGDYLTLPDHHPVLPIRYYVEAVDRIRQKYPACRFYIFSDDPVWCRKTLIPELNKQSPHIFFFAGQPDYTDLYMQTQCKHNIIANSSYSWWGAWLNNNPEKIVISPNAERMWFGRAYSHYNMNDLIPEGWIQI